LPAGPTTTRRGTVRRGGVISDFISAVTLAPHPDLSLLRQAEVVSHSARHLNAATRRKLARDGGEAWRVLAVPLSQLPAIVIATREDAAVAEQHGGVPEADANVAAEVPF